MTNNGQKLGGHITNCKNNPNYKKRCEKISESNKGRKLSNETKRKISEGRIKYLEKNPDKVPYLLNHSREESYPEKYFSDVFKDRGLDLKRHHRIWLYELDFCIEEKRIDIEIDGNQHYLDKRIIESDRKRDIYLKNKGWDIIRIKWSDFKKLSTLSKVEYIDNLLLYLNGMIEDKPYFEIVDNNKYCKCGKKIYKKSKMCHKCNSIRSRKVERPSLEILIKEVDEFGYSKTGRKYNVSDTTIRKWIKKYKQASIV